MDEINEKLLKLYRTACDYPARSRQRNKILTKMIRFMDQSGGLSRRSSQYYNRDYYEDALQQTRLFFVKNLFEIYDPEKGTILAWLNKNLEWKLYELWRQRQQESARTVPSQVESDEGEVMDLVENIAAPPEIQPILEEVKAWVEADADGELRGCHIKGHPEANCQVLILRRLPPETKWKDISAEFNIEVPTLSSFYRRNCLPRLREFGKSKGYL